ncbi:MAG: N-acetylneuraminate synthase family protein [Deltaproteobacteria bacterium]|jgi:N-acetylneuraminate synthase|nr:N-acetylneuraminate synthase family protein [Deltaproteobacteria bacterium]MBW2537038.1 N-acetylneuraminate synthase family protein [Deltaproteobacteria bacterium]
MSERYQEPIVIAEIGCNHRGDMAIAKKMIDMADVFCDVSHVKFQKRTIREMLKPEEYDAPHPNPANSYGDTYGAHREFLEFSVDQQRELKEYCDSKGMTYSCSVWDVTSTREIISFEPALIKVPSACSNHDGILGALCDEYGGEIHISLGMTNRREEETLVRFLENHGRFDATVLYHCISGYPVPFEDMSLLEIERLVSSYEGRALGIGFSGHHLGIAIDVAAYTLGARWVERHYTLDRTWKGTDHAASLEPMGLRKLQRDLRAAWRSLTLQREEVLPIEQVQRDKLKWNR